MNFITIHLPAIAVITIGLLAALLISWWLWQAAEDWEARRRERVAHDREFKRETERHCEKVGKAA